MTPVAKEIGLGATLFLMTQKALFYLFIFLAIINCPLFLFYAAGPSPPNSGFIPMLGVLSLGNLGTTDFTCNSLNVGNYEKKFGLMCNYGTMTDIF